MRVLSGPLKCIKIPKSENKVVYKGYWGSKTKKIKLVCYPNGFKRFYSGFFTGEKELIIIGLILDQ